MRGEGVVWKVLGFGGFLLVFFCCLFVYRVYRGRKGMVFVIVGVSLDFIRKGRKFNFYSLG